MKKILALILLISSFAQAQYTIKGTMSPALKSDWVILYKIEGTKQIFVQNTKIKVDHNTVVTDGIGHFKFTLPANAKKGSYRTTFKMKGDDGFVDFIFNKENVSFSFNPSSPSHSVVFSKSRENKLYKEYERKLFTAQQKLDSIQISSLRNSKLNLKGEYKKAYDNVNKVQRHYLQASKNMYIHPLIKASLRENSPVIMTSPQKYMSKLTGTFFDNVDFSNKTLLNSSFLVDRITDYVFSINYSDDPATQERLNKQSVDVVLSKIANPTFKKDVIEFLITQFEVLKSVELVDYLFKNHFDKLPVSLQDKKFKTSKQTELAAEVGRIAPDFSWKEKGRTKRLSTLKDAKHYLVVFWSTTCPHCLKEIPLLHTYMKGKSKIKVVAFALERDVYGWENYKKGLPDWHNAMGLGKWESKTARIYNIVETPSYFILDANKKIIAKPYSLEDVKTMVEKL